jgi:hypothetical protein
MDEPGAAKKPTRKRAAAPTARAPRKRPVAKVEEPVVVEAPPKRRSRWLLVATAALVVAAGAAAAALLLLRDDDTHPPAVRAGVPVLVSADELAAYADATGAPIYWAGGIEDRGLELTTTSAGTFVRYLRPGIAAGSDDRALTIATYPLANAFATATARSRGPQMSSERTPRGGLAVWSRERPTSVYLAFPDVRQLIEIYSPDAAEARRLAGSELIVAVR